MVQAAAFTRHLPQLTKLIFLSSAIHMTVFMLSSSLVFAVGQVQDVGLIFLSAMASDIADIGDDAGLSDREIISTTLVCLTASTALVGLFIIAVGACPPDVGVLAADWLISRSTFRL